MRYDARVTMRKVLHLPALLPIPAIAVAICCAALLHGRAAQGASPAHVAKPDVAQGEQAQGAAPRRHKPQFGTASVYARVLDGKPTASGEPHDSDEHVAAHRTMPLGTTVRVTNLANHRSTVVRINDRGPQVKSRIIDLSPRAAADIGLRARGKGLARVRLDVIAEPTDVASNGAPRGEPAQRVSDAQDQGSSGSNPASAK